MNTWITQSQVLKKSFGKHFGKDERVHISLPSKITRISFFFFFQNRVLDIVSDLKYRGEQMRKSEPADCLPAGSTLYLIINPFSNDIFRLFQTESLQTTISNVMKMVEILQTGRKHCGKRRNCSLRAISPFSTVFSKDLYCRHVKTRVCLAQRSTIELQPSAVERDSRILCGQCRSRSDCTERVV